MRRLLPVLALLAVACGKPLTASPSPPTPECIADKQMVGPVGEDAGDSSLEPIGLTGAPFNLTLAFSLPPSCTFALPADEVVTEVLDPTDAPVAHSSSPVKIDANGNASTILGFTPLLPGSYHLTARFEPAVGRVQRDVEVALDRTHVTPATMTIPGGCDALEVLTTGLVVCHTQSAHLKLFRNSAALEPELADVDGFAVAGKAVWTRTDGVVRRYEDQGGAALEETPGGSVDTGLSGNQVLMALESEALVVSASRAVRVQAGPFGLTLEPDVPVMLTAGSLVAAHPRSDFQQVLVAADGEVCRVELTGATVPDCMMESGLAVLGSDSGGLWVLDGQVLQHLGFDSAAPDGPLMTVSKGLSAAPALLPFTTHYPSAPAMPTRPSGTRQLVLLNSADGVVLEDYAPAAGFQVMPSSSTLVRAQNLAGDQLLFAR